MAEQADLSTLTDEQLGVYRDLLAKKQAPAEKPPTADAQPQTFGHGLTEFGKQINPLPMITGAASAIAHPLDTRERLIEAGANELGQARNLFGQGRYSEAAGHGMAGLIPAIGPAAAKIGEQVGGGTVTDKRGTPQPDPNRPPDPAGGLGAGAGMITSIAGAPALTKGAGRLLQASARPLVKSALGLAGKAESYGANPAAAVLNETSGVRPSTIAQRGQERITNLSKQLDTAAATSTATPSLTPARNVLSRESASAAAANSEQAPREIGRMSKQLTDVRPGFAGRTEFPPPARAFGPQQEFPPGAHTPISFEHPTGGMGMGSSRLIRGISPEPAIAAEQPASQFLGMKRQFDNDFISNWNPAADTKHGLGVAREAYGAMADELNRTVPGAADLNGRMQSLIPAVKRAEAVSHNAGAVQKIVDRFSRPTGALTPALIGERLGGIPGALAGLGLTEAVSDPMTKMIAARNLYGGGRLLRSPMAQRTAQAMPILRQNQ